MTSAFGQRLRAAFAPPAYLSPPFAGVDLSTSGVKAARLALGENGLTLAAYSQSRLAIGAFADGEIVDHAAVTQAIKEAARGAGISAANVALPETKSYLFETAVDGEKKPEWRLAVEQHLEELVPLPPMEAVFDIVPVGRDDRGAMRVAGVAFANRLVDMMLSAFDEAGVGVRALEGETFSMARAMLPAGDESTTLLIDVGKTTTKLAFVVNRIPRFAATIGIGGHALTLAVQKHFGVTEAEARKVKAERGIVPTPGNEDYIASMLSTVSAIRDEISVRLNYWQEHAARTGGHSPVTHAILAGGNASLRGLPEYLESSLRIPVSAGDVFTNLAPRDSWIPSLDYTESLAFATAVGLGLRDAVLAYA